MKLLCKLALALILIQFGLYGLCLGVSILPSEFTETIVIIFGSMLVVGGVLYTKILIKEYGERQKNHN